MTDLFRQIKPRDEDGETVPVDVIVAAIYDYAAGYTTKAQIVSGLNFDSEAEADLDIICTYIDGLASKVEKISFGLEFWTAAILANRGLKYTTRSNFAARLGLL